MSLYGSVIEFWTAFDSIISGERQGREFDRPETFLQDWRSHLAARAQDAATRLSQINGVTGLILGGGIGKGDMWPLSDVDFIPVYRSEQLESTRQEVADVRVDVERRWLEDGFPAYLDIGGIWFTEEEVQAALSESPNEIHSRLHEKRWYHGIEKD